jgi:serine/threonine protein kinase
VAGDLKPLNIVRMSDGSIKLIDLDASALIGSERAGAKSSTAYSPPELFRHIMMPDSAEPPLADASFDVWGIGVLTFEMSTGESLMQRNQRGDNIKEQLSEQRRLCAWHTISDNELERIQSEAAKQFVRWCLKSDPRQRPSLHEMLSHPFLGGAAVPRPLPMVFHAFMSHCQREAAGDVGKVYELYMKRGLHNWLDMKQVHVSSFFCLGSHTRSLCSAVKADA